MTADIARFLSKRGFQVNGIEGDTIALQEGVERAQALMASFPDAPPCQFVLKPVNRPPKPSPAPAIEIEPEPISFWRNLWEKVRGRR